MPLEKHIKNLILQTGPISMAEFMQIALAHPDYGYYKTQEPFGKTGDFTTAPEISQMFGELIGIWCADIWQKMGCPSDIELVEIGPGRGTLMDDLLRATRHVKGFHESMSISMVETSKRLADIQFENINNKHPRIKWLQSISEVPQKPIIIVANELFDALPVNQYINTNGHWYEKMLGLNENGELEFKLAPPESFTPQVLPNKIIGEPNPGGWPYSLTSLNSDHNDIPNIAVLERCPLAITIMEEIAARIKENGGAALIIDYGYIESEYKNTIFALKHHKHQNILEDIGMADLSAHVDFGLLKEVSQNAGINVYGAITQAEFLRNMGIEIRVEKLSKNAENTQKEALVSAMERLTGDEQMGKLFKVLAVSNGAIPAGF